MKIIDNINSLLGDDLKKSLHKKSKLKIAASCFSIYAYEALKFELAQIDSLQFIFTSPTFVADEVTDKLRKERREFFIPKSERERSLYGSEFEIQLKNKLTQRAIARECAEWIRKKAVFRSNKTIAEPHWACGSNPVHDVPCFSSMFLPGWHQSGPVLKSILSCAFRLSVRTYGPKVTDTIIIYSLS